MSGIDELFGDAPRKGRVSRCAVCGADRTSRVQVTVSRVGKGGRQVQGQNHTVSATLCDKHAASVWRNVTAKLPGLT